MRLPNSENVWVPEEKITKYLLVLEHKNGGSKADIFARFGFRVEQWEELAEALRVHAANNDVVSSVSAEYGMKYVVDGRIDTPSGRTLNVEAVWQIDKGKEYPRLVTAYPN